MKRKNLTRNALVSSILAMLLCISMLVGTTFAWFTDEVVSGVNTIAAGNLDVELYHSNNNTNVIADANKVGTDTKLFDDGDNTLWEPGKVVYENFQVVNAGSLALKYSLKLDVVNESVVNGHKLSEVIKVGIVPAGIDVNSSRDDIINNTPISWYDLNSFELDAGKLEAEAEDEVVGIVLYWEPQANDIDNRYNMNNGKTGVLNLEVGVTLVATQEMSESDSFDEKYDEDATYTDPTETQPEPTETQPEFT